MKVLLDLRFRSNWPRLLSFLSVILFLVAAKLSGAAKEVALAYSYGTGPLIDSYTLVFSLYAWPMGVWIEVMSFVLIPIIIQDRSRNSDGVLLFQREAIGFTLVAGVVAALLCAGMAYIALRTGILHPTPTIARTALSIFAPLALMVPFSFAASVYSIFLMARESRINSLFEGIPSLVLLTVLMIGPQGPVFVVGGTVLGYFAYLAAAAGRAASPDGGKAVRPSFARTSEHWRDFWPSIRLVLLGQLLTSGTVVVDQLMVVSAGDTANAVLGYSSRLIQLLVGIGSVAISRFSLPIFSNALPSARWGMVKQWMAATFAGGLLMTAVGWLAAPWIVKVLFERGAFHASDAKIVVAVFRYGLLQLPCFFTNILLVQYIVSCRKYGYFIYAGVLLLSFKIFANSLMVPAYGVSGVALSTALRSVVSLGLSWAFIHLNRLTAVEGARA